MSLTVSKNNVDDIAVIEADGEMDYETLKSFKDAVEGALTEGVKKFILDLKEVAFIDSSALGALLYDQRRIRDQRGEVLVITSSAITDVLNLTHLESYFTMVDSVENGKGWFKQQDQESNVVPLRKPEAKEK